jgi:enamine deaminase RidA (YjgF/YER057c/UK114 family)
MLAKIAGQENACSGMAIIPKRLPVEGKMAIKREKIQPQGIHVVIRAGQPAYTQVVSVSGTGRMIFVAGQLARDAEGKLVGAGDMRAQIEQVGENIKTCLEAAGASLADIVKTNTFVTDYTEFAKHGEMRMRYFGPATPTSTTVEIRRLADPDAMIEIEAIAVVDG